MTEEGMDIDFWPAISFGELQWPL